MCLLIMDQKISIKTRISNTIRAQADTALIKAAYSKFLNRLIFFFIPPNIQNKK